jgi:CheY-like chemotaxis protein
MSADRHPSAWQCFRGRARQATAAIRVALEFRPQLVFLDFNMPGDDGVQVLKPLRPQGAPLQSFLAVCPTGCSDTDIRHRCLDAGFDSSKRALVEHLREILQAASTRLAAGHVF